MIYIFMHSGCSKNKNRQNFSYFKLLQQNGKCLHKRNRSMLTFTRRRCRHSGGGVPSRSALVRSARFVWRRPLPSDCRRLRGRRRRSSGVFGRRRWWSAVFGGRPRLLDWSERLPRRRRRWRPSLRFLWRTGSRRLPSSRSGVHPVLGLLRCSRRWVLRILYVHKDNADG